MSDRHKPTPPSVHGAGEVAEPVEDGGDVGVEELEVAEDDHGASVVQVLRGQSLGDLEAWSEVARGPGGRHHEALGQQACSGLGEDLWPPVVRARVEVTTANFWVRDLQL